MVLRAQGSVQNFIWCRQAWATPLARRRRSACILASRCAAASTGREGVRQWGQKGTKGRMASADSTYKRTQMQQPTALNFAKHSVALFTATRLHRKQLLPSKLRRIQQLKARRRIITTCFEGGRARCRAQGTIQLRWRASRSLMHPAASRAAAVPAAAAAAAGKRLLVFDFDHTVRCRHAHQPVLQQAKAHRFARCWLCYMFRHPASQAQSLPARALPVQPNALHS